MYCDFCGLYTVGGIIFGYALVIYIPEAVVEGKFVFNNLIICLSYNLLSCNFGIKKFVHHKIWGVKWNFKLLANI